MLTYITAFIFYTLAMIGILMIGFVVYKKFFIVTKGENKGLIKILDSTQIAPKKMLLVIKVKNEKFLIASGAEHTTFLSKLDDDNQKTVKESKDIIQNENIKLSKPRLSKEFDPFDYEKDFTKDDFLTRKTDRKMAIKKLLKDLKQTNNAQEGLY